MDKKKNGGSGCIIVIVIIALVFVIGSCSSGQRKKDESRVFQEQMNKDPNNWTKEEKNRFNNFLDWMNEN